MKTIEVKTNIMCNSCISKATPTLNDKFGEANWSIDILTPKKVLTVKTDDLDIDEVIATVENAGYKAELL